LLLRKVTYSVKIVVVVVVVVAVVDKFTRRLLTAE
jgi:hypothetical protein